MVKTGNKAIALGYFDGLHIAHMRVLSVALSQAENGLAPAVLLFDRPPAQVLTNKAVPRLLTDADRDRLLTDMGFTLLRCNFSSIRGLSPEAFVCDMLKAEYGAAFVSCGFNYRFGLGGKGDAALLQALCVDAGIQCSVSAQVTLSGESVSSSAIRSRIEAGEMAGAVAMLGRPLFFSGPVFRGDMRGREMGFPTANQYLPEGFIVPKFGVYRSVAEVFGKKYPAVTNIGCRPTFDGKSVRSETHVPGFDGDLYGETVTVFLYDFLRPERPFSGQEDLRRQIARDVAAATAPQKI
ncbi:MAG: riboflavin biosynthesis protein RibF [Clostridia bacterium]|nr:riboflavin biosynthesis protein RibF [Clostridia bacterium]